MRTLLNTLAENLGNVGNRRRMVKEVDKRLEENPRARRARDVKRALEAGVPRKQRGLNRQIRKLSKGALAGIDELTGRSPRAKVNLSEVVYGTPEWKRGIENLTRSEQELGQRAGTLEDVLIGGTFFGAPAAYGISKRLTSEPELEKELIEEIGEERANRLLIGIFYDKLGMQVDPKEMSSMAKEMTPQDREEIKLRIAELRDAPVATDQELREIPEPTLRNINVQ